jgi:hypothetical protein
MECLNHFAPAIQALAAIFILLLTGVLAYATWQYVKASEALQKPCVTVQSEPRVAEDMIIQAPYVAQAAQQEGRVVIRNIGTGPALNVQFGFLHTNAEPGGPVMHPTGFIDYLQAGQQWRTQVARPTLATRNFAFDATYESLSRKKHQTKINIEEGVIKSFTFQ